LTKGLPGDARSPIRREIRPTNQSDVQSMLEYMTEQQLLDTEEI